jgi:cell division protease FtsH
MNIKYFLLFLIPSLVNSFKYNYQRFNPEYNHLDKQNIERLEKMFYIKNNRYSPYKNILYYKQFNNTNNNILNITELLENLNDEFLKNLEENKKDQTKTIFEIKDDDPFEDDFDFPLGSKKILPRNGYIDPFGVFRYNIKSIKNGPVNFRNRQKNTNAANDEFSNDNNFEIIKNPTHTFKDVGGYEKIKAELLQSADILINYEKYKKYNVRTPKGIIFEGPPGNGKTLMAKGFSGELNVSFIPVSGSEFSEKYVGVGASRVRDLFKLANDNKPCIIFIDEIDAIARKRGNDMVSSNSEKDQTLNQLLINLDGFKSSDGVFVIGATNRVDLLDPALIRPGRIDKNIYIGNPDTETRKEIAKIHLNGKPTSNKINIDNIVEITNGFSGAQIENLLNEAMLYALRDNREIIEFEDLEFIGNRIIAGWQATESKFSDDIINRIVIHELGHALVGFLSPEHAKLLKVTINLWSPKTPGYTVFDNSDEDVNIYTKNGLLSHLMVLLGGRVAEELFYGYSVTTGAKKDLEQAYHLAQNMILHYGMGKQNIYPDLSDQSKFLIDQEVNKILMDAHSATTIILKDIKDLMVDCADILKRNNLLKPESIVEIINKKYPEMWNIYKTKEIYK